VTTAAKPLPARAGLSILFAHQAYSFADVFAPRAHGLRFRQVWNGEDLAAGIADADVVVVSMLWKNHLLERAPRLRYVQSVSAGTDQFDKAAFAARGVRLASAHGVNSNAVSEHAIALMLSLARMLHTGRDNQVKRRWRGMIKDPALREDEMGGKTLLVVGLGRIGARIGRIAKALDMHVIAVRRTPAGAAGAADEVHPTARLLELLPRADVVALCCPLTPETTNLIDARALAAMKPGAHLVNVARGKVVDEFALIDALRTGRLAAAALDVTAEEPLGEASPLWGMENVVITPHTAGETRRYESAVIDILMENLERLWGGERALLNEIV
jgi:phosphoglycerate dehydrogenase-like enzyme